MIGEGASGVVWAARDAAGHVVAVKIPHAAPDLADSQQAEVERHVLMAVHHEHLVGLRDVVPLGDGRVALVFDLVGGESLVSVVQARGRLRPGETVTVVTPLAGALAVLHAAGSIHADVSAGNVRLAADGRPVLLDLGSARLMGSAARLVCGTAGFVAPEVRLGADPGRPADIFALGAVAWFCCTGNGAPDTEVRLDQATIASHVGPELAAVIGRCLDPDPRRRPTAGEAADLFYAAAAPEPVDVVVAPDAASALTHRLRAGATNAARAPGPRSSRWRATLHAAISWVVESRAGRFGLVAAGLTAGAVGVALALGPATPEATRTPHVTPHVTPSSAPSSQPPSGASRPGSPRTSDPAPDGSGLLQDPLAPGAVTVQLVQALSDRRAAALVGRDTTDLGGYAATGSPAYAADAGLIASLRSAGLRWEGLRLRVETAVPVEVTPTASTIRARVDWAAFTTVSSDGSRRARPGDHGEDLDFTLERGPAGWRIVSISPAPAT